MKNKICYAITLNRLLLIEYKGDLRIIEPHCYGIGKRTNELLRAYQVSGQPKDMPGLSMRKGWKLFDVEKIERCNVLDESFVCPRDEYVHDDSAMGEIICQIEELP